MERLRIQKREQGVTLVELMIVVAILGVVVAAAYNMFEFQQKSYTVQDQVAVMQQNVRVGLDYMVKEIRMAGYVPEGIPPNNTPPNKDAPGSFQDGVREPIDEATGTSITFEADVDNDGGLNISSGTETVRYALNSEKLLLTRQVWDWNGATEAWVATDAEPQTVADNIESISFAYFTDNDGDGQIDEGELHTSETLDAGQRSLIRQITLTMTARIQNPDPDYTNPVHNDSYRRRTLTSNICLRNMKHQDQE